MPEPYVTSFALFWGILVIWLESKTAKSESAKVRKTGYAVVGCYFMWAAMFCVFEFMEAGLSAWSAVGEFIAPILTVFIFLILWLWWTTVKDFISIIAEVVRNLVKSLSC